MSSKKYFDNNQKCAPGLEYTNGSCIPLSILTEMAEAYNKYKSNNLKNKYTNDVSTNDQLFDLTKYVNNSDKLKTYLVDKFQEIYNDKKQHEWIKQHFMTHMNKKSIDFLKNNTFRPSGPQGQFDWLSTINIDLVLEQYEYKYNDFEFLGAVPIDFEELTFLPFQNMNFNDFEKKNKKRIGIIFNLDEHYKSGSHWVSLFCNLEKGQIYYSDSYGILPEKRIVSFIDKMKQYMKNKKLNIDYQINRTQHQTGGSECGVYSINFILRLLKGKTFEHITNKRLTDEQVNKCRNVYFTK